MKFLSDIQKRHFRYVLRAFLGSVLLAGLVFLTPRLGSAEVKSQSIFAVAHSGVWGQLFELPAMLCGVRIMVLGLSIYFAVVALEELFFTFKKSNFSLELFMTLNVPTLLAFCFGFFYLVKGMF